MKVKTWIPLVLAVALGLIAAKLVRDQMHGKGEATESNSVATVTAAHDIEPGHKLTAEDLTVTKLPATAAPTGAFHTPNDLLNRVTLNAMVKGDYVLPNKLAPDGTDAGVQALIKPGMRAITIQVTEFSGLAGMLIPGCKVDIISVIRNDPKEGSIARTIVQNVEVRAVGRNISSNTAPPPSPTADAPTVPVANNVTLLVTPEQAEAVQLASVGGAPWLVLRNSKDDEAVKSAGTSMADLRGDNDRKFQPDGDGETTKLTANDPFAPGNSAPADAGSSGSRTVTFIRATKVESVNVKVAPTPPTNWISTSVDTAPATEKE